MADELVQDAVIRNLEIIGAAVTKLSPGLKAEHTQVPWGEISGMRNRLIHGYISVNLQVVWDTVERWLPKLLEQVKAVPAKLKSFNLTEFGDSHLPDRPTPMAAKAKTKWDSFHPKPSAAFFRQHRCCLLDLYRRKPKRVKSLR